MEAIIDYRGKSPTKTTSGVPLITAKVVKNGRIETPNEFIDPGEYSNWMRRGLPQFGDVLVTTEAPLGEVAQIGDARVALAQRLIALRGKRGHVDNTFLKYIMLSDFVQEQLRARSSGTTVLGIKQSELRKIELPLPKFREQVAIAGVLNSFDEKIELNHRMNRTLEATARAIFNAWFIDFEPIKAKAAGASSFHGIPQDIFEKFPERLIDDDPGAIPAGWSKGKLGDIGELNPESWSARRFPDQLEYVDLANTKWGAIQQTEIYDWDSAPSRARRVLRSGDTIVGTVRPGNGSYALVDRNSLTGSTGFAAIRPNHSYYREQIYCAATSTENIARLAHLADGAAYPAIRPEVVAGTEIVLVPQSISEAFSIIAAPLLDLIGTNQHSNRTLAAIRDTLLPKLISGEIRVPDAESLGDGQ